MIPIPLNLQALISQLSRPVSTAPQEQRINASANQQQGQLSSRINTQAARGAARRGFSPTDPASLAMAEEMRQPHAQGIETARLQALAGLGNPQFEMQMRLLPLLLQMSQREEEKAQADSDAEKARQSALAEQRRLEIGAQEAANRVPGFTGMSGSRSSNPGYSGGGGGGGRGGFNIVGNPNPASLLENDRDMMMQRATNGGSLFLADIYNAKRQASADANIQRMNQQNLSNAAAMMSGNWAPGLFPSVSGPKTTDLMPTHMNPLAGGGSGGFSPSAVGMSGSSIGGLGNLLRGFKF